MEKALAARATVRVIRQGEAFARSGDGWTIDSGNLDDYDRLLSELESEQISPDVLNFRFFRASR